VQLNAGDRAVLFTDGVFEAHDAAGEEFGVDRILQAGLARRDGDAANVLNGIFERVGEFGGFEFEDDATLLVLALSGAAGTDGAARAQRNRRGVER
jgi:serine phosphatase RsbU (regulator of sigma subunit)